MIVVMLTVLAELFRFPDVEGGSEGRHYSNRWG